MTGTACRNHTMPTTFGFCANAASSCAQITLMDAISVASILIIGALLICGLISLSILGLILVVLAILVIYGKVHKLRARRSLSL